MSYVHEHTVRDVLTAHMHMFVYTCALQTRHPTSLPLLESMLEGTTVDISDTPQSLQQLSTTTALTTTTAAASSAPGSVAAADTGGGGVAVLESLLNRVLSDSDRLLLTQAAAEAQQDTAAALGTTADRYVSECWLRCCIAGVHFFRPSQAQMHGTTL
eukprot:16329-Heterococcus_DN1.PRE.2